MKGRLRRLHRRLDDLEHGRVDELLTSLPQGWHWQRILEELLICDIEVGQTRVVQSKEK